MHLNNLDLTLRRLRELLDAGEVSSSELAEECIARTFAAANLNAFASFLPDVLRAEAARADDRLRKGERLPLLGIPIGLKDNIDVVGYPCAAGTRSLSTSYPSQDAPVVQRLRAAGAVIAGKLNMHELAFGVSNNNSVTGPTRNPWDHLRIPGGSSGGSGVAVAAGLVPTSIGTDTGGSVRVPAALCGVTGFRPTVGRIPGDGIVPISSTRDTVGPLAHAVQDCVLIDQIMSGDFATPPQVHLKGLRLGVPRFALWQDLASGVADILEATLEGLARAGAILVEINIAGLLELAAQASAPVTRYEFARDMRRYLATAGRRVTFEDVIASTLSPDVRDIVGTFAESHLQISESDYHKALADRAELRALYQVAFQRHGVEALVFPTTVRTASSIGEDRTMMLNGRAVPTFPTFIRQTEPGSIAGLPGISLPAGLDSGLPVGLALDGLPGSDKKLLAAAASIQSVLPAPARLRGSLPSKQNTVKCEMPPPKWPRQ
ncbi:indoleacetamide hydrolase [Variovorax sp. J31P179]|uniref:indoleacetamide hydrolase n=1 Tax=Variovorax sp. J31P179 TaxID=3053508 RepID=UPI002574DF3C|nr:indoleacetamide hydrolase [Variovorax sp. J31P179]MDM0085368.1 indoleacetamide hydrolase [Variovorax sp. J31P179]